MLFLFVFVETKQPLNNSIQLKLRSNTEYFCVNTLINTFYSKEEFRELSRELNKLKHSELASSWIINESVLEFSFSLSFISKNFILRELFKGGYYERI